MKIAIHDRKDSYSEKWIAYCQKHQIEYKVVNAYGDNIVEQLQDCDAFMWHHTHLSYKDNLIAKQILFSIEQSGKDVYPNYCTTWHFDDKVGQKYLLESVHVPLVPSHVFYTKSSALKWVSATSYPIVFKLRGGAGASNVKLVKSQQSAKRLIRKAFGAGFKSTNSVQSVFETIRKWRMGKKTIKNVGMSIYRLLVPSFDVKMSCREKGYVYFQEFIPNNKYDTRVVVIGGERAVAERRMCRKNDFRASGSGVFDYTGINKRILEVAFETAQKLRLQSVAFDFVMTAKEEPLIVEISYAFGIKGISHCPGYWTSDTQWHEGDVRIEEWIVEDLINQIK